MSSFVEVRNLKKYFKTPRGMLHAVDGVSMNFEQGETMGIVGESGCGKSTLGRTLICLQEATDGTAVIDGNNISEIRSKAELRRFHEEAQIIFQDPYSSLNPRMTVEQIIREPLSIRRNLSKGEINDRVSELMEMVGIDARIRSAYPHELDGGRRQRVVIGRALSLEPKFIVCDEPVSALDVSIQAQILNLLMDLQEQKKLTYMFITHDMSVVRHISNSISVMYLGQLVETSPTKTLFTNPIHPYTKALLSAIPSTDINDTRKRVILKGELSSPINPKPGCRFAARCPYRSDACAKPQQLEEIEAGHFVSCCRAGELLQK